MTNPTVLNRSKPSFTERFPLVWAAPLAMAAASAANLALYVWAGFLFPEVTAWPGSSAGQIIGANVVYLLFGALAFAVVKRIAARPEAVYRVVAAIGLLISLTLPISAAFGYGAPGVPAASVLTAAVLSLMHVISFAISVPLFVRYGLSK